MFKRIAIMGAGSLGTILGAYISLSRQADLIDTNRAHVAALQESGARVGGTESLNHIPVWPVKPEYSKNRGLDDAFPKIQLNNQQSSRKYFGCFVMSF